MNRRRRNAWFRDFYTHTHIMCVSWASFCVCVLFYISRKCFFVNLLYLDIIIKLILLRKITWYEIFPDVDSGMRSIYARELNKGLGSKFREKLAATTTGTFFWKPDDTTTDMLTYLIITRKSRTLVQTKNSIVCIYLFGR